MFERAESRERDPNRPGGNPLVSSDFAMPAALHRVAGQRNQTFTRIFRWRLPAGQIKPPSRVEVVGSFTQWLPVVLLKQRDHDTWQVVIDQIPGHMTHRYMLLVDGRPVHDIHCDGLAVPSTPEEIRHQIHTEKGPRILMLFAPSK